MKILMVWAHGTESWVSGFRGFRGDAKIGQNAECPDYTVVLVNIMTVPVPRFPLPPFPPYSALFSAPFAAIVLLVTLSTGASEFRVIELEREVRELRQDLRDQTSRIEALERQLAQARAAARPGEPIALEPLDDAHPAWIDAALWERVQRGMTELEVIGILGPPTSYRDREERIRTLHYAVEVGPSGFLAGQVVLTDLRVSDVQTPRLR
jgi:hypothetical protein